MDALLFQLSVFHLFNKILNDPAAAAYEVQSIFIILILERFAANVVEKSNSLFSSSQELVTFAKFVINRFFAVAAKNSKAYVELLFWKNVTAAHEMTEGYVREGLVTFLFHDYVAHNCLVSSAVRIRRQEHVNAVLQSMFWIHLHLRIHFGIVIRKTLFLEREILLSSQLNRN